MPKPIINDVAKEAGVSIKTVSRVLNREQNVRSETREKVLKAANKLGYQPNRSARGLAGNRTYLIALLYDNPSPNYLMDLQSGILKACQENAYGLVLHPVDCQSTDLKSDLASFLAHSPVDGVILTPPVCDIPEMANHFEKQDLKAVAIEPFDISRWHAVTIDDRAGAKELTEHLISLGHESIGFIKGHPSHGAGGRRFDGFCDALREADIKPDENLIAQGAFSFESGLQAAEDLLKKAKRPTAIFAANDDMAAATLQKAHALGFNVPDELSVAGFDNTQVSQQVWPPLTTINQPIRRMGHRAVNNLLTLLREGEASENDELPFELVIRASTGKAKS